MTSTRRLAKDDVASRLALFPDTLDLDALARETKAIQRRRAIRSGADLLRLGLAWGPGACSLREAAWAGLLGFARLTDGALIQRSHWSVGSFEAVTAHLCGRRARRPAGRGDACAGRSSSPSSGSSRRSTSAS